MDPEVSERKTKEIMERIKKHQEEITTKTIKGRGLAQKVANGIHLDKFEREQRYEIFINKMMQLYKNEKRATKRRNFGFWKMATAPMMSETPVKLILSEYSKMSSQGFDGRIMDQSVQHLLQVVQGRGNQPRVFGDLSIEELDISHRMTKVVEDLKFALTTDQYFSSHLMANTARNLGELGYKNTELLPLWFAKIDRMLQEDQNAEIQEIDTHELFNHAIYGSYLNQKPRHYVYKGHLQHQEFKEHLQTLLDWKDQASIKQAQENQTSADPEGRELQVAMEKLIDLTKELKGLQEEQQAAIASLRDQYFKLSEAQNRHEFLSRNKYLRFDMLELQELLVRGGFIDPKEALQKTSQNERMERAVDVFYDLVLYQHQELLSPHYDQIIQSSEPVTNQEQKDPTYEIQNRMNAYTMSSTIVGVAQQALSFRRDAVGYDYPTKFYEELLMPPEWLSTSKAMPKAFKQIHQKATPKHILMERSYLKAWRDFIKNTENFPKTLAKLIADENDPRRLDGQLVGLRALSACKFDEGNLRTEMLNNIILLKKKIANIKESQVLIDGLVGIAHGPALNKKTKKVCQLLLKPFENTSRLEKLTFKEKIELINAICVADLHEHEENLLARKILKFVIDDLDSLHFDITDNELSYENFEKLFEVYQTLRCSSHSYLNFKDQNLLSALQNRTAHLARYQEHQYGNYDPLRPRVVSGLAHGLSRADIQFLHTTQQGEVGLDLSAKHKFAFEPDILMGYKGQKLGLFVLTEREVMRDSQVADGRVQHRFRILERLHKKDDQASQILPVAVPITSVVTYDLENYKLELNENFNIKDIINKANNGKLPFTQINIKKLAHLAANLTKANLEQLLAERSTGEFEKFMTQFISLLECKRRVDILHEPEQLMAAYDELKFHLLKLDLMYNALLKQFDIDLVKKELKGIEFAHLVQDLNTQINKAQKYLKKYPSKDTVMHKKFDRLWFGKRQSVELISLTEHESKQVQKDIEPELLRRSFMTFEDYHHYSDWQEVMTNTYDQFNMLQMPHNKKEIKYYFDEEQHKRRIPKGIFPHPDFKRTPLEHPSVYNEKPNELANQSDRYAKFEQNPIKFMRENELKQMKTYKNITPEVSMICNLQNIKQSMKSELNDKQLANMLFNKFEFTDLIIQDHIAQLNGMPNKSQTEVKELPRNSKAFRKFMERQDDFVSPFNQFYLQEAVKQGYPEGLYEEYTKARKDPKQQAKAEKLLEQMENALVNYKRGNEDFFNLSKALDNHLEVKVDLQSLGFLNDKSMSDPIYNGISDLDYLQKQRVIAESSLIKSTIIYKAHNNIKFTKSEKEYLQMWVRFASDKKTLVSGESLMVPDAPARLPLSAISADDLYALNTLPGVSINRVNHGEFALNELVLELSHMIDRDTIRKTELKLLEKTLKSEFNLSDDFNLVDQRNKEIDFVQKEFEEISWRIAATFNDKDKSVITEMISLGRGVDNFDKVFFDLDMKSFEEFFAEANTFDQRQRLLENWICRKEEEYRRRVTLPVKELNKSDNELYAKYDLPMKNAREKLLSKMLVKDEFGANVQNKQYNALTSKELHLLVESLCVRLNLFSQKYPAFVPQVIRAIMEHNNLSRFDRSTLDTYCTIFELDWRGDRNLENKEEFLMTNPIYIHKRDQSLTSTCHFKQYQDSNFIMQTIQRASKPFLDDLVAKLTHD